MGGAFLGDFSPNAVFENPGFGNHWLQVRLVGAKSNSYGIGARIRAEITENGKTRSVYKWVNSGGSFGAIPLQQHLGLGTATRVERLEVYWPTTDVTQTFRNVPVDCRIRIAEGKSSYEPYPVKAVKLRYKTTKSDEVP